MSDLVWNLLPLPPGTYRYVFAKRGNAVEGTWVSGPAALARFIRGHPLHDCYIQLNPVRTPARIRPRLEDVTHVQAVLLDLDPVEPTGDGDRAVARLEAICDALGVPTECSTLIHSGRGRQLWLHTDAMPIIGEGSLARAVRAFVSRVVKAYGVACGFQVDASCVDLTRLARLPGSTNQKTMEPARVLRYGKPMPALWLLSHAPDDVLVEAVVTAAGPPPKSWPAIAATLTTAAFSFITEGAPEGGRHKAAVACARSLRDAAVAPETARRLLWEGASKCDLPEGFMGDVERIWRDHFRRSA